MGRFWVNLGPGIEHFFTKNRKNQRFSGNARSGYADFWVRETSASRKWKLSLLYRLIYQILLNHATYWIVRLIDWFFSPWNDTLWSVNFVLYIHSSYRDSPDWLIDCVTDWWVNWLTMVESACQCSKPFRNESLQKIAIIHHTNWRKRQIFYFFVWSISPRFLTQFYKKTTPQITVFWVMP